MALENKRQLFIIAGAVVAGIAAVILTSNYVKSSIEGQTQLLAERYELRQKQMAEALAQRSDQQIAALENDLAHVKSEQTSNMQKQMAVFAQEQAQAARLQNTSVSKAPAPKPSLALETPPGKRAVTVMIDSLSAVGGLLNAGDFVDVIAQLNVPSQDADKKTVTAMIFQNLEVLAINTNLNEPGAYDIQQAAATLKITFAVDPQQAGFLAFANKNGSLELALRSPKEKTLPKVKADTWKTLADYVLKHQGLDIQNPDGDISKPVEGTKTSIQIFRGGKEL